MNIGLISREYPPQTGWGGIGSYTYALAHALKDAGHDVRVISRSERAEEYAHQDGAITVHRIRERKGQGYWINVLAELVPYSDWQYSRRVRDTVQALHAQTPFDVLEAPEYKAEAFHLVREAPAPVIVKLHTPTYLLEALNQTPRSLRAMLLKAMERSAARRALLVTAPCQDLASRVRGAWQLSRSLMRVVPNPVDVAALPVQPAQTGAPMILYVGRFERRKGLEALLRAMPHVRAQLPDARLILVGGSSREQAGEDPFARWVEQEALRGALYGAVELVPWQDHAGVLAQYARSSVVVLPSLYENYPTVCLEAMAAGRPVVASRVGGLPEMITPHVTGWLVPPGDARVLATTLVEALRDPRRLMRMGEAARRFVETHCDAAPVAARTMAVYQEAQAAWQGEAIPRVFRAQDRAGQPVKRRVLYVTTERGVDFSRPEGAALFLAYRRQALEEAGVAVAWGRYQRPEATVRFRSRVFEAAGKFFEVCSAWADAWHVWRKARLLAPQADIIHEWYSLYGLSGRWLARRYRKPLVFEMDAPLIEEYTRLQGVALGRFRQYWALRFLHGNLRAAAAIIVRSQAMADMLIATGVPAARLTVIPGAVDPAHFAGAGLPAAAPHIIFLGTLQPWHGCAQLLDAFAAVRRAVPAARLTFLGDGKMRAALEQQAQALQLNGAVTFAGAVPHAQVPQQLARAAIAVAPYPTLPVPFYFSPMKIFEYMAAGRAIVASRIGQISTVLEDQKTALLVAPGDAAQLAHALIRLLQDEPLRLRLGAAARAAAQDYTWAQQASRLLALYEKCQALEVPGTSSVDISVIIPTRNRSRQVQGLLASLRRAAYPSGVKAEVLVVDNGSTDDTAQVVAAMAQGFPVPLSCALEPVAGASRARNRGAAAAQGQVLAFLDDDCEVSEDWLVEVWQTFAAHRELAGCFGRVLPLGEDAIDPTTLSVRPDTVAQDYRFPCSPFIGHGNNMVFRRAWFERIKGFDVRFGPGGIFGSGEELELGYRLLRQGAWLRYEPRCMVRHLPRPTREGLLHAHRRNGYAIGAFFAKHIVRGDGYALKTAWWWWQGTWRSYLRAARTGQALVREVKALYLRMFCLGAVAGTSTLWRPAR